MKFRQIYTPFFILLTAGAAIAQTPVQDSLSVQEAVRIAIRNNPAIMKAADDINATEAGVKQSRSSYFPDMNGSASYSRIGPVQELTVPGLGSFSLFPENNYDISLGLQQNVYDFGRRSAGVELAKSGVKLSRDNLDAVKSSLAYQTIQTFYTILLLQENIAVVENQIFDLEQHQKIAEKRVQTGSATEFDVLTTRVRVASAQSAKLDIVDMLKKQNIRLRQLLAVSDDAPLRLKGEFTINPPPDSVGPLISLALNQRPEILLSKDSESAARIQYKLASMGKMPMINMSLSYGFKNGYFPNLNALKANWVAGMRLQVPVFEGFRTRYRKEESHARVRAAIHHQDDMTNLVVSQVKQAFSEVRTSNEKLKNAELQVRQAEQALSMAKVRYQAGVITNLDLLDAETSNAQANQVFLRAKYDYVTSQYRLEQATGTQLW